MKQCNCLPAIKDIWCKDPHCNDDRIGVPVYLKDGVLWAGLNHPAAKEDKEVVWKIKVNDNMGLGKNDK